MIRPFALLALLTGLGCSLPTASADHHAKGEANSSQPADQSQPANSSQPAAESVHDHEKVEVPAPREVDGWKVFGAEFAMAESVPVSKVLGEPTAYDGKTVRVEGEVADVCQSMGCWMVLQDGERTLRVTMKDHGFGVDKDCAGKTASLEGLVVGKPVDPEKAKHYADESAKPELAPELKGGMVWEIVATTVALKQ